MSSGSGSKEGPIPISSDDTGLPPYLARHFNFGFDDDDVSALLTSIDASQDRNSAPSLPRLPAEILFHIVEYVPIDYVLQWRLVCRGFRDCIDGPVMYNYIKRAEIIGYLGAQKTFTWAGLDEEAYETLNLMRCRFERLQNSTTAADPQGTHAKWEGKRAVFRIDDTWYEKCNLINTLFDDAEKGSKWSSLLRRLGLKSEAESYGKMRWCMRLDNAVLDLHIPMEALRGNLNVDLPSKEVAFKWKRLLFQFVKTETQLRVMMEQTRDSIFRYDHQEDCLREVRRQRFCATLNPKAPDYSLSRWGLSMLPPLFSKRKYDHPAEEFRHWRYSESSAIELLMPLRKEAAMGEKEANRLRQLAKDRNDMVVELQHTENTYAEWMRSLGVTYFPPRTISISTVPNNPFAWTDEVRRTEEARVWKWKAQHNNMQQVALLAEASMEAVSVPENAFDELGSDI